MDDHILGTGHFYTFNVAIRYRFSKLEFAEHTCFISVLWTFVSETAAGRVNTWTKMFYMKPPSEKLLTKMYGDHVSCPELPDFQEID